MKTPSIIAAIALGGAALALSGCSKEVSGVESPPAQKTYVPSKYYRHAGPSLTYYTFGTDITEDHLLKNPDDLADEQFNYVNYALTLGLLQIYSDPALTADLVQAIINQPGKCYDLVQFADAHPGVDAIFNTVFAARFADFSSYGNNWQTYVDAKYLYDVHYRPVAYFANEGVYNLDEEVYVGAPFEVNEEVFPDFDDDIPVWINTADNGRLFTTINEEKARLTRNPILMISNGHEGDAGKPTAGGFKDHKDPVPNYGCPTAGHIHEKLSHRKFKINERYERTGKSEYAFCWHTRIPYIPSTMSWAGGTPSYFEGWKYKKVDKDQIGQLIDFDFKVFYAAMWTGGPPDPCFDIVQMANSPGVYQGYVVGAYEKDWYSSNKKIFNVTNGVDPYDVGYPRKYDNEWYFLDPAANNSYPFNIRNPQPNSMYINYTKGELWLERNFDPL